MLFGLSAVIICQSPFLLSDAKFWFDAAQDVLNAKADSKPLTGKAKNVIMFLGDGLSIPTLAATRVYLGKSQGKPGEETVLSFEEFPNTGLSKASDIPSADRLDSCVPCI